RVPIQPVALPSASSAHTQPAMGKYESVAQIPANSNHEPNRGRSATAPEMSATVMIANVAPNAAPASAPPSAPASEMSLNGLPATPGMRAALVPVIELMLKP